MSTDLDDRLRGLFTEVADATPVNTPSRFQPDRVPYADSALDRPHRARRLVVAGVAAVVVVIVGLVVLLQRDDTAKVSTASVPSTDPVLWVPSEASGTITEYYEADEAPMSQGAVRAPDGTLFGISLLSNSGFPVTAGEERQIGGNTVRSSTEPSAPDVVSRVISFGCSNLVVVSTGEDPWSTDAIALLQGIALVAGTVRLELPSGWTSLGGAASRHQFATSFDVRVDGGTQTVSMWQMPNAPVGFYLTGGVSNLQPVDIGGAQGWTIESAGSPDYRTLVAERDGTAFSIAGPVPASLLIEIEQALVRAPRADWTAHDDPQSSNITAAPAPAGCEVPALEILSNP
jgi:hypothetical protein